MTAKLEDVGRYRSLLVEQLTAPVRFTQAARELVGHGVTTFVEVGPGNVLSGLLKRIDSSVKTLPVNDLASLDAAAARAWLRRAPLSARSRGSGRSSPAARAGSAARSWPSSPPRARRSSFGYMSGADEAAALAEETGARAVQADVSSPEDAARLVEEAGDARHPRQQRGRHARRPARAHVRRRLARRDRHQPQLGLLHLPRGDAADDEEARGRDRQHQLDRRPARQLGPDELRRLEGGHHRLHEVARARARVARRARQRDRAGLREVAAHRRPAGGGDAGDARPTRRSAGSASRRTSRGRYGSSAPTRPRSSRARCCSSTADWGCR